MHERIEWQDLGSVPYDKAWRIQEELRVLRDDDAIVDRFLFVEHPSVFTLGKRDCSEDFLTSCDEIAADGIDVIKCNRGGRVTYHGPGQIVGYFIFKLSAMGLGVKEFVSAIEEICLRTLNHFEIQAARDEEHPGLWIKENKIVAIGLNISHDVTQHGFAMNVDCDMAPYRHIVACGIKDRGITTFARVLGLAPSQDEVKQHIIKHMSDVLSREVLRIT
ncbi:MAG: lipoyl(octanoyl) transferase LipB [Deltaproteobacteria bacterium]|jgi:lipoyl(octanoyl) transferase|nr:lipoyl(octanoyl) transferase LipB [Deltaproteobacteria bacterium]